MKTDQLSEVEPALSKTAYRLIGGLQLPNDETGDCQLFTQRSAKMASEQGVRFYQGEKVKQLLVRNSNIKSIITENYSFDTDAVVMACGVWSKQLLQNLIKIPVYPLKGYSLTLPIINADVAPRSTVLDETYKIAVTRFDERIRVGGIAENCRF